MKTWYITGGTPGGFGMAYANAALESGDRVVLTTRRPEELRDWAASHRERTLVLPLDVTDSQQVRQTVAEAESRFGGIDILVNNAGRGWYGSVEGMDEAALRRGVRTELLLSSRAHPRRAARHAQPQERMDRQHVFGRRPGRSPGLRLLHRGQIRC